MLKKSVSLILLVLLGVGLSSCGGGGGSSDSAAAAPSQTSVTISGSVVKGPVSGAKVTFYTLNTDGSRRSYYGPITTDSSGNFSTTLTPAPTGPLEVVSSGGSYVDESTGVITALAVRDTLTAVWPAGTTRGVVTPLTDIAAARAWTLAARGTPSAAQLATAIASSNIGIAQQYGIDDILSTVPAQVDNSANVAIATRAERNYGLVLAGITHYAGTLGVRPIDLVGALAVDAQGGALNGLNGTAPINVPMIAGGQVALAAGAGTTNLQTSIDAFLGSARNMSGFTEMPIMRTPVQLGLNAAGTLYTTTTVLPAAISGEPYAANVTASGGVPPYKCAVKAGSALPVGYTLSDTCRIDGTGAVLEGGTTLRISPPFTIVVTDSATPPVSVEVTHTLTTDIPAPTIAGSSASGTEGSVIKLPAPTVTGGSPPYHFKFDTFLNGVPPLGASVDLFTGAVTVPATAKVGNYSFGVCAVDMGGRSSCAQDQVTINELPTPAPNGVTGIEFTGGVGGWGSFANVKISPAGMSGVLTTCEWTGNLGSKATTTTTTLNSTAVCSNAGVASWPDTSITITATVTGTSLKTSIVY